jgi:hypothetical protein
MAAHPSASEPYVFVSYASADRDRVLPVVRELQNAGYRVWLDLSNISGGANYGAEIVEGIKDCAVLVVACTPAALESRNIRQEIQLAWKYQRPYLPLLLEPTTFTPQIEYWLEGHQWVEVLDYPVDTWLPNVLAALNQLKIVPAAGAQQPAARPSRTRRHPPKAAASGALLDPSPTSVLAESASLELAEPSAPPSDTRPESPSAATVSPAPPRSRVPILAGVGVVIAVLLIGLLLTLGPLRGGASQGSSLEEPVTGAPIRSIGGTVVTQPMGASSLEAGVTPTVPILPMGARP